MGYPGEIQNHCLGMQQLSQKSQGSAGAGSSKGCEGEVKRASVSTLAAKGQLNSEAVAQWGQETE